MLATSIPLSFVNSTRETAPRVYSYTRFSTPEQADGDSRRRQSDVACRWIVSKNTERAREDLPPLVLDERLSLADLGVSAYRGANTIEDKGLGGFLRACSEGLIPDGSYLIVESLDRISRMTPYKVQQIIIQILEAGVTIATLNDAQEYNLIRVINDPTALLISLMVSWRAHEESKVKGQRLAAAWSEKRLRMRDGRDAKLTAKGPSWLVWTPEGWQERKPQADTVRGIYRMTLDGMGEHKIAETLNLGGVPVMGRGRMWHRSTVAKILRSPSVMGTLVPGHMDYQDGKRQRTLEQPIPNVFPSIVSEADWTAVRALKDGRAPAARGRGARQLSNMFAGLARCPECGAALTRVNKGSGLKGGKPKLVCTRAKVGAAEHGYRSVDLSVIQSAFLASWQRLLSEVPAGDAGANLDRAHDDLIGAIDVTECELADVDAAFNRKPTQGLVIRRRALEAALASYRSDRGEIEYQRAMADHGLVASRLGALADAVEPEGVNGAEVPSVSKINAALRTIFDRMTVDYRTGYLRFNWRQGGETSIRYAWIEHDN